MEANLFFFSGDYQPIVSTETMLNDRLPMSHVALKGVSSSESEGASGTVHGFLLCGLGNQPLDEFGNRDAFIMSC